MPFIPGDTNTYYHLTLNKLVKGDSYFAPAGLMALDADRLHWVGPDNIGYKDISAIMATRALPPLTLPNPFAPIGYLYEKLSNSSDFATIHARRLYEPSMVPKVRKYPYSVVSPAGDAQVIQWLGEPGVVGKCKQRFEVISVRRYDTGGGDMFDFQPSFRAIVAACTGDSFYTVMISAVILGVVTQSEYIREVRRESYEGDVQTLYHGALIDIVWETWS